MFEIFMTYMGINDSCSAPKTNLKTTFVAVELIMLLYSFLMSPYHLVTTRLFHKVKRVVRTKGDFDLLW